MQLQIRTGSTHTKRHIAFAFERRYKMLKWGGLGSYIRVPISVP